MIIGCLNFYQTLEQSDRSDSMTRIDLHTHTTASDGTYTPKELIDYALEKELSAIAITDHDTLDGLYEAKAYAKDFDLEVISGIEFSTHASYCKNDLHILGLYINEHDQDFIASLDEILTSRDERNLKMIEKLNAHGLHISMDDVLATSSDGVITRAHFGRALLEKGYIQTISDAFSKYIGNDCPCYVERGKLSPKRAIQLIIQNGGVPVLAHPMLYPLNLLELEAVIKTLTQEGLMGIEGIYSTYNKNETAFIHKMADKYALIITGGSDFHGSNKKGIDLATGYGQLFVPDTLLPPLRALKRS